MRALRRIARLLYWAATGRLPRRMAEARAAERIRASGVFDEAFYRARCPELDALGLDPVLHYVRSGAAEGRWPSPLFDPGYYRRQNPDVLEAGEEPLHHFVTSGAAEGRWPNPLFDTAFYRREHPVLARTGLNPLAHWRRVGAASGCVPHPRFDPRAWREAHPEIDAEGLDPLAHRLHRGEPLLPPGPEGRAGEEARPARFAVLLHLYYPDLWGEVRAHLERLDEPFDLYVSLSEDTSHGFEERVRRDFPRADVRVMPNRGRDIAPLLEFLRDSDLPRHEVVCKIHTKKSPHRLDGDRWRGQLLHRVLGSPDGVREILDTFARDEGVGLVGPASALDRSPESWGSNRRRMAELAERMGVRQGDLRLEFFAGSMFWFRPAALEPMLRLGLRVEDFEEETGELDGTLHHAFERLFPLAAKAAGYRVHPFERERLARMQGTRIGGRRVKLVAFYLPQFHPIPENEEWWGPGFTEWTNVTRARPLYRGHPQPRLPRDLGFYDLRVPEVREAQAELASRYGIHGFCYHYYWFDGRRLLDRPLREVAESGRPDFPFCICWANENWTRRWDGLDDEVLIGQEHSIDSSRRFIREVAPLLKDPRYIRYEGRPVLLVYRARALPRVEETLAMWREECRALGVGPVHLCAVRFWDVIDVHSMGFDAAVDFPPHHVSVKDVRDRVADLDPDFDGILYDYGEVVRSNLETAGFGYERRAHRGLMTAWDNTARRGPHAHVAHGATPELYRRWLRGVLEQEMERNESPESLVFVNAWNEWAEGAVLEPEEHFGHGFLEATRAALEEVRGRYEGPEER